MKLIRKCIVCGNRMIIEVDEKGHYDNGHYFGKFKIPLKGTGRYKKIKTTKITGKEVSVVKWLGKEKEVEYWECNGCYED